MAQVLRAGGAAAVVSAPAAYFYGSAPTSKLDSGISTAEEEVFIGPRVPLPTPPPPLTTLDDGTPVKLRHLTVTCLLCIHISLR